jgi:hypothetical protein
MGVRGIVCRPRRTSARPRSMTRSRIYSVSTPGADAGQQFAQAVGLGDIVVRAHFQAEHAVDLVTAHGEHDDRLSQAELSYLAADVKPGPIGQAHVKQDVHRLVKDYLPFTVNGAKV